MEIPVDIQEKYHGKEAVVEFNEDGTRKEPVTGGDSAVPVVVEPAAAAPAPAFDETVWLTEKTGGKYKTWDDLWNTVTTPPAPAAPSFPNEESRLAYEAVVSGKVDDLYPVLEKRRFVNSLKDMTPEQLVREHMKKEFDFTGDEVNYEYSRRYSPVVSDEATDIEKSIAKKQAEAALKRDAAQATTYFTQFGAEIKFPVIAATPVSPKPPELSVEAKMIMEFGSQFKSDKVSVLPFEFNAPDTGITVKGQTQLDSKKLTELKSKIATAPEAFIAGFLQRWSAPDGQVNADAVARDVLFLNEPEYLVQDVVKQSYDQTFTGKLARDKNYKGVDHGTGGAHELSAEEKYNAALDRLAGLDKIPVKQNG